MLRSLAGFVLVLAACGVPTPMDNVRDVRVAIPAADPAFTDFVTPEKVFQPGEETMWCFRLDYKGADTAFTDVVSLQGKFGHHIILLAARADDPSVEGDVYDCSKMNSFDPFAIPVNNYPPGYGGFLQSGRRLIIQMHYVNTGTVPIRVRDVVRLTNKAVADVTKWTVPYAFNDMSFSLPPHSVAQQTKFDCVLPQEVELLAVGGHMHEFGANFLTELTIPGSAKETLYSVDKWTPDYRDSPPITLFTTAPKVLPVGSTLSTRCEWNNSSDKTLEFPAEMCATFALVAGTRDAFVCNIGMKQ